MDEAIRYEGYWWLPGANDNGVPGILKFDPDKGASLRLMGSLQGLEGITEPLDPEIIHGLSSDGKLITLKDCGQTLGNLRFRGGFSTSACAANTIFVGRHFERPEDVGFERLVVEYLYLGAWADSSGFEIKFVEEEREPKKHRIEVKHECPDAATAYVGDDYGVTLDFGADFKASQRPFTRATINQPAELVIEFPEKQPFDRLSDIVFRLQHLLSLGMRRSAYPVAIRGYTGIPGKAMPVQVYYRPLGRMNTPQERPELHEMLFSRRDLPEDFGPAVARWLGRAEKLDPVCRLFLGTVYNPQAFIEQKFLSLVTALEVYHRRAESTPDPPEKHEKRQREILEAAPDKHRNWLERKLAFSHEPTLEERLRDIFRKHLEIAQAIVGRSKKARSDFIREVVDARNFRAHFGKRLEGKATRGAELHPINQKLRKLLEACLMAEIGFEDDKIRRAVFGLG